MRGKKLGSRRDHVASIPSTGSDRVTSHAGVKGQGENSFKSRLLFLRDLLHRHHVLLVLYGLTLATFPLLDTAWHRDFFYITFLPTFLLTVDTGRIRQASRDWGFRFACSFISVAWLSQFWSPDLDLEIFYNATRKSFLVLVFLLATIQLSIRYEKFLPGVAIGLLITSVIAALLMIGEAVSIGQWPPPRLGGLGRGKNPILGALLFGVALITAYDVFRSPGQNRSWRIAVAVGMLPLIAAILLTQSRGPWLALYVTAVVVILAERRWLLLLLVIAVSATAVITVTAGWTDAGSIITRTDSQRLVLWAQTLDWIAENVLFGIGYGTALDLEMPGGLLIKSPHNLYLSVIVYFGVIGATPFFGMLGYFAARMASDLVRGSCRMSILLLIVGLVSGLFDGSVPIHSLDVAWLVLWLPIAYEIGRTQRMVPAG